MIAGCPDEPPQELNVPFYFTPGKVAGTFHCSTPALVDVACVQPCITRSIMPGSSMSSFSFISRSALLNAGYRVSRSHASPGSLKTTAPREAIHDVFRAWAQRHPVRMDRISETAPAAKLLSKEIKYVSFPPIVYPYLGVPASPAHTVDATPRHRMPVDFKKHPESVTRTTNVRIVRYQQNPAPNWGPGSKAGGKRKRAPSDEGRGSRMGTGS